MDKLKELAAKLFALQQELESAARERWENDEIDTDLFDEIEDARSALETAIDDLQAALGMGDDND